eukprot:GHUV01045611.1.p1 GENE.GHUV01045611.1~~GHUV01045611.1.p1  ORF type:complete len:128 (-),score=11.89 GHUV01045611.1:15-398(-)
MPARFTKLTNGPPIILPRNNLPLCSVAALAVATRDPSGSSSSCSISPSGDIFNTAPQTLTGGRQLLGDQEMKARSRMGLRYLHAYNFLQHGFCQLWGCVLCRQELLGPCSVGTGECTTLQVSVLHYR